MYTILTDLGSGGSGPQGDTSRCVPVMSKSPPQYLPITTPDSVTTLFPHYRLLAYTEGANKNIEKLKSVKFTGVPVLFIPDMSGAASYKVSQYSYIYFTSLVVLYHSKNLLTASPTSCR